MVGILGPPPGIPWSRWFGGYDIPEDVNLPPLEEDYLSNLVSLQAGDEQDLTNPATAQQTIDTFTYWRAKYPGQIHVLSQMQKYLDTTAPLMDAMQPDIIVGGSYRMNNKEKFVAEPVRRGGSPQKMYKELLMLRELCLRGQAGSGGKPIPYGLYTQVFYQVSDGDYKLIVSESQMRLQQMAAWAVGCKWICAFIYNSNVSELGAVHGDLLPVFF